MHVCVCHSENVHAWMHFDAYMKNMPDTCICEGHFACVVYVCDLDFMFSCTLLQANLVSRQVSFACVCICICVYVCAYVYLLRLCGRSQRTNASHAQLDRDCDRDSDRDEYMQAD
jgi:hypothetical protein